MVSTLSRSVLVLALVVVGIVIVAHIVDQGEVGPENSNDREQAYDKAIETVSEQADWPATPEALIREFWRSANKKDYEHMTVLCPDSRKEDYKTHYDEWTPSPAKSIGKQEQHPQNKNVVLYPVTISFPNMPDKMLKMAVRKAENGAQWLWPLRPALPSVLHVGPAVFHDECSPQSRSARTPPKRKSNSREISPDFPGRIGGSLEIPKQISTEFLRKSKGTRNP